MKSFDLLNFRKEIIEHDIILSFEGKMSQGVLVSLVDTLKEKLKDSDKDPKQQLTRRVFSIFVEMAQNIQYHSAENVIIDGKETGVGVIVIREDENSYLLTSGNNVTPDNVESLIQYCDELNSLDSTKLKQLYKERLRSERPHNAKGAGLGLIDIGRKTGLSLNYDIQPIDVNTQFFSLSITLPKAS